jgi:hypothetical protein
LANIQSYISPISIYLNELISYVIQKPERLCIKLLSDPGFGVLIGPLLFSLIWQYLTRSAVAKKIAHAEDLQKADPIVNLSVHISSVLFGGLIYVFSNISLYTLLSQSSKWSAIYTVLFFFTCFYLFVGVVQRFFLKGNHVEVYYEIPQDQIRAPWNIPFTWYRFGFGLLSWSTTIAHMMYENR